MDSEPRPAQSGDQTFDFEVDLGHLTDISEDGLLVVDREYGVRFANRVMRQRLVSQEQPFLGRRCYEVFEDRPTPCNYPLWRCPLAKIVDTGKPVRIIHLDYSPKARTVPERYVEIIMYPLRDREGCIIGATETRRDVTAERGLETYILRHHHHLQALDRISSAVSGLWDLDRILSVSLEGVLEIMSGSVGGILVFDSGTGKLRYRASRGLSARFTEQVQIGLGEGIAGRVALEGAAILVEDISRDPRTAYPELVSTEGLKGFAAVPLKSKEKVVGVMTIASREPGHFGADDLYLLSSIGCQIGTAIERAELYQRLDRARERYKALLQYSLTAQEEARKRIARELHDETSQVITSLALNLQALKSMAESRGLNDPELVRMFDRSLALATHAGNETVRMMKALRPTLLDEMGLAAAVNRHARDTLEPHGIQVHTDFKGMEGRRLPSEVEVSLFRISQGLIGNIREHSQARNAYISIEATDAECVMTVRDDGKGFDVSRIDRVEKGGRGAGLFIMKERVDLIGGTGHIRSEPGKGTEIVIKVPLRKDLADG